MILKASERGGGKQLALHLLNDRDNDHVEVHDIRGFIAGDLVGAMKEAHAVSKGTRCQNFLFSVSLNPPATENVGIEVFEEAIDRIETKNGLTDHPRAIVFHEKEGRRHAHAVWSRIDAETMTARNLSHYKSKLRDISKETYLEQGWKLPEGFIDCAAHDPRNYTLAEYQQAKRMGHDARDLKSMMQECWAASDSAAAFKHALTERGLTLAKGDRRGHVAVTHEGEVLAVSRYTGKKAKEVRAKLGEPEHLPSVEEAKTEAATSMSAAMIRHMAEAKLEHEKAMAPLAAQRRAMTEHHRGERTKLDVGQKTRWEEETRRRSERLNTGLRGLWDRLTGHHAKMERRNIDEAQAALARDSEQRQRLVAAQLAERRELQTEIRASRDRHAELLRDLQTDRRDYHAKLSETELDRTSKKLQSRFERRTGQGMAAEPAKLIQAFDRSARPTPEGRLQKLRKDRLVERRSHDQRHEPER